MSMETYIEHYKQSSEAEQAFRDLFGKEELEEARRKYFQHNTTETYATYLQKETERKLREQDGN